MKHPYLASILLALLPAIAVTLVIAAGTPQSAEAQDGPFRCPGASLYFPVDGTIGWTYSDPASTDLNAEGNRSVHTGVDVFADGGIGSPVYAPADGVITRPPGAKSVNIDLPGVTNLLTGKAGIQVYLAHVSHSLVVGQTVRAGEVIGTQASDHIHISVGAFAGYDDREIGETQDPSPYFGATLNYGANVTTNEESASKCYIAGQAAPAPAAGTVPSEAQVPQTYVVQSGDTLGAIAATYGVSVGDLAAANGLSDLDFLSIGQELAIPGTTAIVTQAAKVGSVEPTSSGSGTTDYTVKDGDTLSSIAAAFGTDVDTILSLNSLTDPDFLSIGEVLKVP